MSGFLRSSGSTGAQNNSCKHEEKKEKFSEKNKQNVDGLTEMNNVVEGGSHDNAKFNFNAGDVIVREEDEDYSSEDDQNLENDEDDMQMEHEFDDQARASSSKSDTRNVINNTIRNTKLTDSTVNANRGDVEYCSTNERNDSVSNSERRSNVRMTNRIDNVTSKRTCFNANAGNVKVFKRKRRKR